jgi:hypothetical protein
VHFYRVLSSKTTVTDISLAIRHRESHLFVIPKYVDPVILGSAAYLVDALISNGREAHMLLSREQKRDAPLTWPAKWFVCSEDFDFFNPEPYEMLWMWGVDRPKASFIDRKDKQIRKSSLRFLFARAKTCVQILGKSQTEFIDVLKVDEDNGTALLYYQEKNPGSLIELAFELGKCGNGNKLALAWGLEYLFEVDADCAMDGLLQNFHMRCKNE